MHRELTSQGPTIKPTATWHRSGGTRLS